MSGKDGITGDRIEYDPAVYMTISAFTAVAWFNVIELNVQVFMTFKRHRGLYFWSLLISSYGCLLHALGFLLKFFQLTTNNYLSVTIITIGWWSMVTGQAVVLYSRLHLVVREYRILRGVLIMIITDAILFHIPTTVLTYGSNSNHAPSFTEIFKVVERIQMTVFCSQEFIISGIYVWSTIRLLRPVYHGRIRKVMMQLIWINLIIIGMDLALLVMEYQNFYDIEATLKSMVYSIKLKLEFGILNQLMTLANSSVNNATKLTLHEEPVQEPKGRSKSLSYIGRYLPRRSHDGNSTDTKKSSPFRKSSSRHNNPSTSTNPLALQRTNSSTTEATWSSFSTTNPSNRLRWIPALDRKAVIEAEHLEHAGIPPSELNMFTNPAAVFHPSNRRAPRADDLDDDLADLSISPTSPTTSTFSGSTLQPPLSKYHPSPLSHGQTSQNHNLQSSRQQSATPLGVLRSDRPSVSDWAHGPDSESLSSSEVRLDLYEQAAAGLHRSASLARANREGERDRGREKGIGMDFMTSAI